MTQLRDYQERAVHDACAALSSHCSALFVCPTGGGKTLVLAEVAKRMRKNGKVLLLSDREQLIHQTAVIIKEQTGLSVGIEQAALRVNRKRLPDVTCATIQSLSRAARLGSFARDAFALILIDEADLSVAVSYQAVLDHFVVAKVFGCTATPDRADHKSLLPNFAVLLPEVGMSELIERGFLAPLHRHLVRIESVDLSLTRSHGGDFSDIDIQRVFEDEKALHEVVRPAIELSGQRPTLVFAATVRHAERLADIFNRYRPGNAAAIHGKMSSEQRADILGRFASGGLRYLCSCALLLRGVDLPFVSCVVMARPTKSRALYCQSLGRGTRVCAGKEDLLVLDYTDNSLCHELMCAIDVLAPESEEVRLHARDILDKEPGGNPQDALTQARAELADPALRASVLARVAYLTRSLDLRRWIDWSSEPLGKIPDVDLAARLGVTHTAVLYARQKRGIPAYRPQPARIEQLLSLDIDWHTEPLGQTTDTAIAESLSTKGFAVSARDVALVRKEFDIPGWTGNVKPVKFVSATHNPTHDLTGRKIGELTVLSRTGSRGTTPLWRCLCSCGVEIVAEGQRLASSHPRRWKRSCGHDKIIDRRLPRDAATGHKVVLTLNGTTRPIGEWASLLGIPKSTIRERLKRGWSVDRALSA